MYRKRMTPLQARTIGKRLSLIICIHNCNILNFDIKKMHESCKKTKRDPIFQQFDLKVVMESVPTYILGNKIYSRRNAEALKNKVRSVTA